MLYTRAGLSGLGTVGLGTVGLGTVEVGTVEEEDRASEDIGVLLHGEGVVVLGDEEINISFDTIGEGTLAARADGDIVAKQELAVGRVGVRARAVEVSGNLGRVGTGRVGTGFRERDIQLCKGFDGAIEGA